MLDLLHENETAVQGMRPPCQELLYEACRNLEILHPVRGKKDLIRSVEAEQAKLRMPGGA